MEATRIILSFFHQILKGRATIYIVGKRQQSFDIRKKIKIKGSFLHQSLS